MRVKQPEVYFEVDDHLVRIASIDVNDSGRWIAWGYEDGAIGRQFIVAEQNGAHRWHLPGMPSTPPPRMVMDAIKAYLLGTMCKAMGEE